MDITYEHVEVLRVIDGDTVEAKIDVGFCISIRRNFRLRGIDTPEGESGDSATQFVAACIAPSGNRIKLISSGKQDKYGRYLADIILPNGENLNTKLISLGYAKPYYGRSSV